MLLTLLYFLVVILIQIDGMDKLSDFSYQHMSPRRCANDTEIIDHLLFDTALHYNKHKLPSNPVNVRIEMWVQEVTSVSEQTQDFEIEYMDAKHLFCELEKSSNTQFAFQKCLSYGFSERYVEFLLKYYLLKECLCKLMAKRLFRNQNVLVF
uniref:Neur_chan_LBD domain-containing protein n=1 Tax=Heterorhabditis bacteriophora TaxID=37862 RepID=A0A1I7XN44_HETBA